MTDQRTSVWPAALVLASLLVAACGSGATTSDGVAQLIAGSPGPGVSAVATASGSQGDVYAEMLAYSQCMREHGIVAFPDPADKDGHPSLLIKAGPGTGIDPTTATFQAAQAACQPLMPAVPGGDAGGPNSQLMQQALAYAQCMRDQGVANYPDPKVTGNTVTMGAFGLDPNNPTYAAAKQACQSMAPGSGGSSSSQGGASTAPSGSSQP